MHYSSGFGLLPRLLKLVVGNRLLVIINIPLLGIWVRMLTSRTDARHGWIISLDTAMSRPDHSHAASAWST